MPSASDAPSFQGKTLVLQDQLKDNLRSIVDDTQELSAAKQKANAWYARHTVDAVYEAVTAGRFIIKEKVEKIIVAEQVKVDDNLGKLVFDGADKLLRDCPTKVWLAAAWLVGKAGKRKEKFIKSVTEKSAELIGQAEILHDNARTANTQARQNGWNTLAQTEQFYGALYGALVTEDKDGIDYVLASPDMPDVSPFAKRKLLLKPVGDHANAVEAIAALPFKDVKEESVFIGKLLDNIGDDSEALTLIQTAASGMKDEKQKTKYQSYASAFASQIIQVPKSQTINASRYRLL